MVRFHIYQLALGFCTTVGSPQVELSEVVIIISMVNEVSDQKLSSKRLSLLLVAGCTEEGSIRLEDS